MCHIDQSSDSGPEEDGQPATGLSQNNPTYSPAEKVRSGQEAMSRLCRTWDDWTAIGEALQIGQTEAMRAVGTNQPSGFRYEKAMGEWLLANGFKEIDKATRSRLLECVRHQNEIETWRARLTQEERFRFNHPNTVIRKWKAAAVATNGNAPRKASNTTKLKESIIALSEQNHRLKREVDAGGGDLWTCNDKAEEIAAVMLAKLSPTKAKRVAETILNKLKNNNKPAEGQHAVTRGLNDNA
jgi:hypothetical protein